MNIDKINRLNNEYRALIREARELREEQGDPSRQEGLCYQNASIKAAELASLTVGAEASHWIDAQSMCSTRMREIYAFLHPEEARGKAAAGGTRPSPKPAPEKKEKEEDDPETAGLDFSAGERYGISKDTIRHWFPKEGTLDHGFDAVVGMEDLKERLQACVRNVRDTTLDALNGYLGMPSVQSFFFYGPPGCGKTFTIEAFAYELKKLGYRYMEMESADIHSKFSGEAEKILKCAFETAVLNAPCILFMDEIDGICQSRSMPNLSDFNMTLTTTFLTSYNDLMKANNTQQSVIFIGATNYPANVDIAMLDRVELVKVDFPDRELRAFTFKMKFEKLLQMEEGFTWDDMAEATEGYNQRDINRVSDHMKIMVRGEVAERASGEEAVELLKSGEYRLTRRLFDEAMQKYLPTPKDEIIRSLEAFENKMRYL